MMSPKNQKAEESKDIESSSYSKSLQRRRDLSKKAIFSQEKVEKTSEIFGNKDENWSSSTS
jgi:hypothetical protein